MTQVRVTTDNINRVIDLIGKLDIHASVKKDEDARIVCSNDFSYRQSVYAIGNLTVAQAQQIRNRLARYSTIQEYKGE